MPAPYYSDDLVTLYHGDCREVTEWLAADVLVMDPPYGRSWRQGRMGHRGHHGVSNSHGGIQGDADMAVRDTILELWGAERVAVTFGDLMLAPPPGNRQTLIYRKPGDAGTRGATAGRRRDVEGIYLVGPWPSGIGRKPGSIITTEARCVGSPHGIAAKAGHPHAKPVDVLIELIDLCPVGGIADPVAGSGTTLLAARQLGRPVIGVEVEERYCELIATRLSVEQPLTLDLPA